MEKLILFLSFLLFNSLILSFAAENPNPVLDSDGEEIRPGVEYYIMPIIWPNGGGVTYGRSTSNEVCPPAVVQTWPPLLDTDYGLPVTFTPEDQEEGVVRLSTDLNIQFSVASNVCIESNVWRVDLDRERGHYFILTNGVAGNPGCGTIANWFKIEQLGWRTYKLVYCPSVCSSVRVICQDVGRFFDPDAVRLGLKDEEPFVVLFVKAQSLKNHNVLKSVTATGRVN